MDAVYTALVSGVPSCYNQYYCLHRYVLPD